MPAGFTKVFACIALCFLLATASMLLLYSTVICNGEYTRYWFRVFSTNNTGGYISDITVDSSGLVYAIGELGNGSGLFVKLDSSGGVLWSKLITPLNNPVSSELTSIATHDNNVYISGYTFNGTSLTAFIFKTNQDGRVLWTKAIGTGLTMNFLSFSKLLLSGNYIYAVGTEYTYEETDVLVVKLNASSGDILWAATIDVGGSNDYATAATVDAYGNIYIGGRTVINGDYDAFIIKLKPSGTISAVWVAGEKGLDYNECISSLVEYNGYLYACGVTYDEEWEVTSSFILKMSDNLTPIWIKEFDNAIVRDLALNNSYIYAVGETNNNTLIAMLDSSSGDLLKAWVINGSNQAPDNALSVMIYPSQKAILIGGETGTWRIDDNTNPFISLLAPQDNLELKWENAPSSFSNVRVVETNVTIRNITFPQQSVSPQLRQANITALAVNLLEVRKWDPASYIAVYNGANSRNLGVACFGGELIDLSSVLRKLVATIVLVMLATIIVQRLRFMKR